MEDTLEVSNFNDYEIIKQIGKGAYGIVYKVKNKSDQAIYALKTIDISRMENKTLGNTLNEIRILCSINHPNIVGYKEAFLVGTTLCVVMEHVGGGDLSEKIASCKKRNYCINEESIWKYAVQILNGLKELHGLQILHRDIKSANIFLSEDFETVKLGDLNIAKVAKDDFASTQIGTPYYLAPEIWMNQKYDYRCDIFSLGCVVYEMATLKVPFDASTIQELFKKITKGSPEPIPSRYSTHLSELIKVFLTKNPKNRPSVYEIMEMPIIKAKMSIYIKPDLKFGSYKSKVLMRTIVIPQNLDLLKNRLPKRKLTDYSIDTRRKNSKESTVDTYSNARPETEGRTTVHSTNTEQQSRIVSTNSKECKVGKELLAKLKLNLVLKQNRHAPCGSVISQVNESSKNSKGSIGTPSIMSPYNEHLRCSSLNSRHNDKTGQTSSRSFAR